jgi:PAS domain S-box-containing protein
VPTTQAQWLHQVGSVLETLNQGVVISDEDRRIVFANSMFLEMSKMPAEEVLGRSVMDFISTGRGCQVARVHRAP